MNEINTDDLYNLINLLSKTEKTYFKTFVSRRASSEQLYIDLFDAIEKQKKPDEEKIIRKFEKRHINRKAYSNLKRYLFDLILQSLESFHTKNDIGSQIYHLVQFANVLYKKALYKASTKILKKAKKLAIKYEYFILLLDVLSLERLLIWYAISFEKQEFAFKENEKESITVQKQYLNLTQYQAVYSQMGIVARKQGVVRNAKDRQRMNVFLKKSLFTDESKAISFNAKSFYYGFNTMYNIYNNNAQKSYTNANNLVKLYEKNAHQIENKQLLYLVALGLLLSCQTDPRLRMIEEVWTTINKVKKIFPQTEHVKITKLNIIFLYELNAYITTAQFDKGIGRLSELIPEFEKHSKNISENDKINFYYNTINIYFLAGKYSSVLMWMNKLLDMQSIGSREDIFYSARLINVLTHLELGNWQILESLINTLYRYTNKKDRFYSFEKTVYYYLKKIIATEESKGLTNLYINFKGDLLKFVKKIHLEKRVMEYPEMISWIDSKIENKSISEILKEKFEAKKEER